MSGPVLPQSLRDNPRPSQWIGFVPGKRVRLCTGKVELGQGVLTALAQIAAEELAVDPARFDVVSGETGVTPEEGFTAGSQSIEASGGAIRLVAAELRARVLAAAALRLNCAPSALEVEDGTVLQDGAATALDYWSLAGAVDFEAPATGTVPPRSPAQFRYIGRPLPRRDLPGKLFGGGFIHDLRPDRLAHARSLHRPWPGAALGPLDEAAIGRAAGGSVRGSERKRRASSATSRNSMSPQLSRITSSRSPCSAEAASVQCPAATGPESGPLSRTNIDRPGVLRTSPTIQ